MPKLSPFPVKLEFKICGLGLFLAGLLTAAAQAPMSRLDRPYMFGSEYVRLDDWARANGGTQNWTVPKRQARAVLP